MTTLIMNLEEPIKVVFKYNTVMNSAWFSSSADVNEMLSVVFFFTIVHTTSFIVDTNTILMLCVDSNVESGIFSAAVWLHHLQKGEEQRPGFYAREHR